MLNSLEKKSLWKSHRKELIIWFFGILIASSFLIYTFDIISSEVNFESKYSVFESQKPTETIQAILPTHITIPAIGVDVSVSNPESEMVEVLDEYLKKGSVHYPGSGTLAGGNMFIFGHSTGLRVVQNQAYKAFNNLKNLKEGDEVIVTGENGKNYIYNVSSIKLATDKDVLVRFDKTEQMLTLSTCNTFGQKSERYVVEAYFGGER